MCKADYAACVRIIKSSMTWRAGVDGSGGRGFVEYCLDDFRRLSTMAVKIVPAMPDRPGIKWLDIRAAVDIIILTGIDQPIGHDRHTQVRRRQTQPTPQAGDSSSPPRSCHGRVFSRQRFFRSSRSGAGQVRDAATRREREGVRQSGGPGVWSFPAFVLSGAEGASTKRSGRITSSEARAAARPQSDGGSVGVPRAKACRAAGLAVFRTGATNTETVPRADPSTHHRARVVAASKKTPLSDPIRQNREPASDRGLQDCYEQLRRANLTGTGAARTVLQQQGMKSWMEAVEHSVMGRCVENAARRPAQAGNSTEGDQRQIVLLLAAIVGQQAERSQP